MSEFLRQTHKARFVDVGGFMVNGMPVIPSAPRKTAQGTPYLVEPGVALISKPHVDLRAARDFLAGFPEENFEKYLEDEPLDPGTALAKYAGQECYMALGDKRTSNADANRYFERIFTDQHTSILEHAYFVFQLYGVDRSFTHELVRHRVGVSYSQVSQRYVGEKTLRFVERPDRQKDELLHQEFVDQIDRSAQEYEARCSLLMTEKYLQKYGWAELEKRDQRKAVRQLARDMLPNCTEAPIVFGVNVRQFRHLISMRGNRHADTPIREVTYRMFLAMSQVEPILMSMIDIDDDVPGTPELRRIY